MPGARHNKRDQEIIDNWHTRADELKADMSALGAALEAATDAKADDQTNALKAVSETPDELRVANYIVLFGGRDLEGTANPNKNADGTRGEFFTSATDLDSEAVKANAVMVDWEHATGRGKVTDGIAPGEFLGRVDWKTARPDERGVWVERVLNRRHKYVQWLAELIKAGLVGNSSEADPARVVKGSNGEIKRWPILRDTLTVSPMEPRMLTQNAVAALKALGYPDLPAAPETDTTGAASPVAVEPSGAVVPSASQKTTEIIDMDEQALLDLLDKRDAAKAAAAKVEAERVAQENERIEAAVKAAEEKMRKQMAPLGRLPLGGEVPHQARFGDTRKYDGLSTADLAFMIAMLGQRGRGASNGALKALGIKTAEDQTEVGERGREALKAIGLEPDALKSAAKADELDYTTQAGYGDEFVPTIWSASTWELVRAQRAIVGKLPSRGFTGPGDTFTLPVEGADPTFYRIGESTDINATTRRPNASIGDSKVATANQSLTFKKVGARVLYSGEMEEDSIIPWVSEVREKTTKAFGESMEHVVIDGDTETGATTNINHIGGTPTSTGTQQDLFLAVNGFRKLALVTNTANSYDANNTLVDTLFLEVAKLLGTAGLNADPQKADFIVDANVFWAVQQIASVKTRDVFLQATLENGMFSGIWGYKVHPSWFMHWRSSTNPRKANTAGKVDLTSQANNTRGAILMVRWDQWLLAYKRNMTMKLQDIPDSDAQQLIVTARIGMVYRDNEASAIAYDVAV